MEKWDKSASPSFNLGHFEYLFPKWMKKTFILNLIMNWIICLHYSMLECIITTIAQGYWGAMEMMMCSQMSGDADKRNLINVCIIPCWHHIGLMINISIENFEKRHYGVSPSMRKFGRSKMYVAPSNPI